MITMELDTLESSMITMEIILIQHIPDQSIFSDDLKPDLLKEIARMDKPNF